MDGGGHDLGEEGRGRGGCAGKGKEIEYIIPSNHIPLIREI